MKKLMMQTQITSSQGNMPKCWDSTHTYLYKCSMPQQPKLREMESEWICCRLATVLGMQCVQYNFKTVEYEIYKQSYKDKVIVCKTFLNKDEQLITPMDLMLNMNKQQAIQYVINVNPKHFHQMFVFDFLVGNTDRHLRNYGIIKSGTSCKVAPVFDNDKSLFSAVLNDNSVLFNEFDPYLPSKAGISSLLYTDAVKIVKQYNGIQNLFFVDNIEKQVSCIVKAIPTDMLEIRRKNIVYQILLRFAQLMRL